MSNNSDLVRTAITKLFIQRDVSALKEYWGDEYRQHNPMIGDGTSHIADMINSLPANFSYEIGSIVSEGDLTMVHARITGFAPTPLIAVDIFRIRDGKIVEHWDVLQEEVPADKTTSGRPDVSRRLAGHFPKIVFMDNEGSASNGWKLGH